MAKGKGSRWGRKRLSKWLISRLVGFRNVELLKRIKLARVKSQTWVLLLCPSLLRLFSSYMLFELSLHGFQFMLMLSYASAFQCRWHGVFRCQCCRPWPELRSSWLPTLINLPRHYSEDLQAQDISFQYGQRRHVTVFRLLGAGSLEELIYSRQIYKQQLSNIAVSGKIERRYFEGVQVFS